ncbi:MAG: aminotransferase class III-fold pyridoxal phosphate-dependent enzyme, partial [Spirochaetes bacterium]|nr:aminotransferase class III-fold pyridoxal phosphate-dependent enzyme [Spirochaetota bacterium]
SIVADTVIELSQKLASAAPQGFNNSFLVTSGALAVEAAMHICWQATGKRGGIALTGAFHGWTVGTRSISSFAPFKYGFNNISGIAFLPRPYCYRCPHKLKYPGCDLHCAYALEDVIKYGGGYDAAFVIMEPIQGFGGHITPPSKEYFKIISDICHTHGLFLIIDEVQTGIAKTGELFASQLYDIPADIITLGKALGGGMAIGDVMLNDSVIEKLKQNYVGGSKQTDKIFYGTHTMDPIIAAAAIAVLEYVEEHGLSERARRLGSHLTERLLEIQKNSKIIGDVRGPGLYVGVEFVKDRETKESCVDGMQKFLEYAKNHGVLFQAGGENYCVLKIKPPLTIEEKNLDKIIEVIDDGVKIVEKEM